MSSDGIAIRVRDVCKNYLMFARPEDRLKQMVMPRVQRLAGRSPSRYYRNFAALKGVSFDVSRGETVGIVGRNGSGKSTLLQIICGTLRPTQGSVQVNGRIAALLELGAGFNPEFTGRENVYLNAAILGLSKAEVDERFEAIARFADIGDFIEQPVKTYSSGMYVRLAFATAINVDPDILVVDEALAVGDEAFQRKCYARIEAIKEQGGTILFVSHNPQSVMRLCSRALLIDGGELILEGRPKVVVGQYQRLINLTTEEATPVRREIVGMDGSAEAGSEAAMHALAVERPAPEPHSSFDAALLSHSRVEYESKGAVIGNVRVVTSSGQQVNVLKTGERYIYEYTVDFRRDLSAVGFGMLIKTVDGLVLGGAATDFAAPLRLPFVQAASRYLVRFDLRWSLNPGVYFLNAGVTGVAGGDAGHVHRLLDVMAVRIQPTSDPVATGFVNFDPKPTFERIDALPAAVP